MFPDCEVPRPPSYGVYIFALQEHLLMLVIDFISRNKFLIDKLLNKAIGIINSAMHFHRRHYELIEKYNVSLKKLLQRGMSYSIFYGDFVYKCKANIGKLNFSDLFENWFTSRI